MRGKASRNPIHLFALACMQGRRMHRILGTSRVCTLDRWLLDKCEMGLIQEMLGGWRVLDLKNVYLVDQWALHVWKFGR